MTSGIGSRKLLAVVVCLWAVGGLEITAMAQDVNPTPPAAAQTTSPAHQPTSPANLAASPSGPVSSSTNQPTPRDTQPKNGKPMDQVDITAQRDIERRTLDHVVIPKFVQSHGATGGKYEQVARWDGYVCPTAVGLDPKYAAYVASRITEIAASIGARTKSGADCNPNVEILFTSGPQAVLDYIAKNKQDMLGYHYTGQLKKLATFNHPVQAWYVTASRNGEGFSMIDSTQDQDDGTYQINTTHQPLSLIKSEYSSEFINVLVIVDADKLGDHSLKSITDYIALLALTRTTSLDVCNELPSILDLLSSGCGQRARPTTITAADTAYLKALYSTDLGNFANFEKGEMHNRMLKQIAGP
jgi:hypothetical protein